MRFGALVVLVTARHASTPREGIDFLPLTVDYREYTYASGRIPAASSSAKANRRKKRCWTSRSSIVRSGRCSRPAGASRRRSSRSSCRPIRRTTPTSSRSPAPAALAISEIPFAKTIAAVRIGLVNGQYIVNPTFLQRKESKLDLVVAGSQDGLVMVEAGAKQVTEERWCRRSRRRMRHQGDRGDD